MKATLLISNFTPAPARMHSCFTRDAAERQAELALALARPAHTSPAHEGSQMLQWDCQSLRRRHDLGLLRDRRLGLETYLSDESSREPSIRWNAEWLRIKASETSAFTGKLYVHLSTQSSTIWQNRVCES